MKAKASATFIGLAMALWLAGPAVLAQQRPAARPAAGARTPASSTGAKAAPAAQSDSQAAAQPSSSPRRDPFRPIVIKRMTGMEIPERLPPGKPGLVIGQLTLQGIVRGIDGKWIAVVDNKTKRAYFLNERDELFNGTVARITPDEVVFEERVLDAAGRPTTREVVKKINPS